MRLFRFVLATGAYVVVASLIYLGLLLQCGLGPDAPAACNDSAESQSASFVVGAIIFYVVLAFAHWRRWPTLKG